MSVRGIFASTNCANDEIILDSIPTSQSVVITASLPDGTSQSISGTTPLTLPISQDGLYTFVESSKNISFTASMNVSCYSGKEEITKNLDCLFDVNDRYEKLLCTNKKDAEKEKEKLDRMMQLLVLSEYDLECGMGDVFEYTNSLSDLSSKGGGSGSGGPGTGGPGPGPGTADVFGCMDSLALNYDPLATIDNGGCNYTPINCLPCTMPNIAPWNGATRITTSIPDANFENYLEVNGMGNGVNSDNLVCTTNIYQQTILNLPWPNWGTPWPSYLSSLGSLNISDFTGLEDFAALEKLCIDGNVTETLDLSGNPELTYLCAQGCDIKSLDLSSNTKLESLWLTANNFSSGQPSITNNINLRQLCLISSRLTSVNIPALSNLETLYIGNIRDTANNPIPSFYNNNFGSSGVSLPTLPSLTGLGIQRANLNSISLGSNVPSLKTLALHQNNLTTIDVTLLVELIHLTLSENPLLTNIIGLDNCTFLTNLLIQGCQIAGTFDVSSNVDLAKINISNNKISVLNLGSNIDLTRFINPFTGVSDTNYFNTKNQQIGASFLQIKVGTSARVSWCNTGNKFANCIDSGTTFII